ncbi:E2 domain-containing protein [Roseovarius mucosus]|uniref:E2 domain-containing protein n=1 Tax=Roseovarius mucosus TaxID=215743 RepID=UPI003F72A706
MNSLRLLLENCPIWVEIQNKSRDHATIVVAPPLAGSVDPVYYCLDLALTDKGGVSVREEPAHRRFPEFCMERHINPGGTFCLEYGSEDSLGDADAANRLWSSLETFLHNQEYAAKRREWPLAAGLSHGEAALEQLAMEELAKPLGWTEELLGGMFRGRGWLAQNLPRVTKKLDRVVNARTPCPRGCNWKHKSRRKNSCELDSCETGCRKQHKPILRANCPNRWIVEEIVLREHRRRAIEAALVADLREKKIQCCGTMKNCSLR